jgi:phosphoribosyl 1,2-cyclic phosphodiesterase
MTSQSDFPSIKIRFRGVRGSTPSPGPTTARYGGNTSCIEVRAGSDILILDAGTGIRSLGADLVGEFGSRPIHASVLISHTHWDHIQGLPFFAPGFVAKNRIRLIAPKNQSAKLKRALANQMEPIHFPIGLKQMWGLREVEELASDNAMLGPFSIRSTELNHPGECAGFRIEAGGASLAYLPDHEPFYARGTVPKNAAAQLRTEALIEFVREVDMLILDAQYTSAEYPQRIGWGHGCLPETVGLARKAGVKHLVLFHHDPSHDDDQVDAMVETSRELARPTEMLISAAKETDTIILSSVAFQSGCRMSDALYGSPAASLESLVAGKILSQQRRN